MVLPTLVHLLTKRKLCVLRFCLVFYDGANFGLFVSTRPTDRSSGKQPKRELSAIRHLFMPESERGYRYEKFPSPPRP